MRYTFSCPLDGCNYSETIEAENRDAAVTVLAEKAKIHLEESHPDLHKTDDEIRSDVESLIKEEGN